MKFRSGLSLLFGFLLILGVTVPAAADTGFVDVPDTNPFAADITWLAAAGITQGCNKAATRRPTTSSAPKTTSPANKWQPSWSEHWG